jgi:hypothetical protein
MDFRGNGAPDPRPDPEDGQYVYEIFFRYIEQVQLNPKTGRMDSYPLPDNPMDICFRLHGLREWFPIFSNVSTVPADLLAKALRELNTR